MVVPCGGAEGRRGWNAMRALVTGAAGFIGSHLVDFLLSEGHEVVGLDDLSAGEGTRNLMHLFADGTVQDRFTLIRDHAASLKRIDPPPDVIFHLAGHVGVGHVLQDPLYMLSDHVRDAQAVCEAAEVWGATVVMASSSEVYGDSVDVPFREDAVLRIGPSQEARSAYAVSKLCVEHYALASCRERGVSAIVVRLFNVAGPRQRAEGGCVVPRFVTAALTGRPLHVHGDGMQQRCFSHVSDVVQALVRLAETPASVGRVVNVGQAKPITMKTAANDIARYVAEQTTLPFPSVAMQPFDELPSDAGWARMRVRVPDVRTLTALTGMTIPYRWTDIVADSVGYWRQRLGRERQAA